MLAPHAVGEVDDGEFVIQTQARLDEPSRQVCVCRQSGHSPISECRQQQVAATLILAQAAEGLQAAHEASIAQ